jgi:protein kinase-like protein
VADSSDDVTLPPTDATTRLAPRTAARPADGGRFTPGAIIAGRYRLVALLGRGGMGEVYRADDLTLDHPVALKFLPAGPHMGAGGAGVVQLHNELRIARQVSHKNVCRLYDLGDADGRRFLTMEYVDGEDLGSLLRRIGRFPQDRAIEIARQLCAGVAAAHERGVVHRDLKPANVMIDGEGHVRITDFGIASAASDTDSAPAGTPQYMAPEQLAGRPASIRSDIYALGLILFEIFTGKRAYDAKSIADLREMHDSGTLTTPSAIVRDLDPGVERVILRCLDRDPERRPASALAVAAALPGGNPLADALAAGETPSPDLLAAAGETEALSVGRGLAAVGFIVAGVMLIAALSARVTIAGRVPLDKPPAVLTDRAQQIIASLGYTDAVADAADGFTVGQAFLRWTAQTDARPERWDVLNSGSVPALVFWHRTSPRLLVPTRTQSQVTYTDPPMTVSGMTALLLDTRGRMIEFQAVPSQFETDPAPAVTPPWEKLFDAAGLPLASFTPVAPQWSPRDFADTRAAWEGAMPDHPEYRLRVEAAAFRGRPTSMFVLGPWSRPSRMALVPRTTSQTVLSALFVLVVVALVCAALLLARHNLRAGRADKRGAFRLAMFMLIGYGAAWVIGGHHVADVNTEVNNFTRSCGPVLLATVILWLIYVALEPYVRRFWPDGILGWSRLMSGYVRDPRVGHDVLLGCVFATTLTLLEAIYHAAPPLIGYPAPIPSFGFDVSTLSGVSILVSRLFDIAAGGVFTAMFAALGFVLLRLIFKQRSATIVAAIVMLALVQAQTVLSSGTAVWIGAVFQACAIGLALIVVVRYGLLAAAIMFAVGNIMDGVPLTSALSHWTATTSNMALAVVFGLTLFGFFASRAGQPLFGNLEVKREN